MPHAYFTALRNVTTTGHNYIL